MRLIWISIERRAYQQLWDVDIYGTSTAKDVVFGRKHSLYYVLVLGSLL